MPSQIILFTWELTPGFFKINFNNNVFNNNELHGASFVIRSSSNAFVVAGSTQPVEITLPVAELCAA